MRSETNTYHLESLDASGGNAPRSRWRIPPVIPVLAVVVLGIGLRVAWLDSKPLWEDEAWTFITAVSDEPLEKIVGSDPHPLSFYWLCRQMPTWCFSSDWAFRLPHAVASCLALLLIPIVFKNWLSPDRTRCLPIPETRTEPETFLHTRLESINYFLTDMLVGWCVLVFAFLPINIRYAQEARSYAFCQLAGVLVLLTYLQFRQRPGRWAFVGLVLASAASLHIDGFGWITPFAVGVHALYGWRDRIAVRSIVGIFLGGIVALPYLIFRVSHMLAGDEMHAVGSGRLGKAFAARWLELSPIGIAFDPVPSKYEIVIFCVAGIAAMVFLVGLLTSVWRRGDHRRGLAFALFILPFGLLTLLSLIAGEIFIFKKYLIPTLPGVVILFTLGFLRITRGSFFSALLILMVVPLGVSAASNVRMSDRADWRELFEQMETRIESGDGFAQLLHLNYPEYSFGPLRAYAWRAGSPIDRPQLFEYATSRESAPSIRQFCDAINTDRIWTITTRWMAEDQMPDLSAFGDKLVECKARGCRATLWKLHRREPDSGPPSINDR